MNQPQTDRANAGPESLIESAPTPAAPQSTTRSPTMILKLALFVVLGSLAGYAYYKFIGCRSGTCPITSNPYISTLYGAILGYLISGGWK